jgi:hypothetical protein
MTARAERVVRQIQEDRGLWSQQEAQGVVTLIDECYEIARDGLPGAPERDLWRLVWLAFALRAKTPDGKYPTAQQIRETLAQAPE